MLKWLQRLLIGPESSQRTTDRYVTQEQLELALAEHEKEADWMLNEWYEKFNTLHARLAKRTKRSDAVVPRANGPDQDPPVTRPSLLHLPRRPWSI